jgi:hypothetical protein
MKDGQFLTDLIDFGTVSTNSINMPESASVAAHTFNYQWIQNERNFILSSKDNIFGGLTSSSLSFTLCVYPINGADTECGPTIALS